MSELPNAGATAVADLWIALAVRACIPLPSLKFEAMCSGGRRAIANAIAPLHDASFQRVVIGSGAALGLLRAA